MEEYQVYLLAQDARLVDALRIQCLSRADAFTRVLSSVKRLLGPGSHAEIWKDGVRLHQICVAVDASAGGVQPNTASELPRYVVEAAVELG